MFERFTERARTVIVLAQQEARTMRHQHIGTEHLLLGLLGEPEAVAAKVLGALGVTLEQAREWVLEDMGRGDEDVTAGQIPFTPRAKKVCELALREALSLGHNYIGTEHILLGLASEGEGAAARLLGASTNIDHETIRNRVLHDIGAKSEGDRLAEYRICQQRGHVADDKVLASRPPRARCRHCGTVFWTETVQRESGAPVTTPSGRSQP